MNKKTVTWVIVAVLVLAGIWYLARQSGGMTWPAAFIATTTQPSGTAAKSGTAKTIPAKTVGVGTLAELLRGVEPLYCSVNVKTAYLNRSGNVYIAGGELHADLISVVNGVQTKTTMIDDRSYLYVWKNGSTKGLKLPAPDSTSGSVVQTYGGLDLSTKLSYNCVPWFGAPANVFTPPSTVTFSNNP